MAKKKPIKALFKAAVRFGGGGYGKQSARIGCKIPAAVCTAKLRDEYFVNASLRVILSLDPKTDEQPVLDGMEGEYPTVEVQVKVNQYSTNDSDVSISMTFDKTAIPAEFLQTLSHANGSIYILSVTANEDGTTSEADDDAEDDGE